MNWELLFYFTVPACQAMPKSRGLVTYITMACDASNCLMPRPQGRL